MDADYCSIFLRASLILLLCITCSLSDDFDVTTIYKFEKIPGPKEVNVGRTAYRVYSVEIHGRNNARGLPFLSQDGNIIEPNVGIDIETCTVFDDSCNWKANNFTTLFEMTALLGKNRIITTTEDEQLMLPTRIFRKEFSITFNTDTSKDTDGIRIYLMDSRQGLSKTNMCYIIINIRYYEMHSKLWKCKTVYRDPEIYVDIGHDRIRRSCISLSGTTFPGDYWERVEYEFSVKTEGEKLNVTEKLKEETNLLLTWNNSYHMDDPLNVLYYKVGSTSRTAYITSEIGPDDDQQVFVLSEDSGSIISEEFIPTYSKVCVSVVYSKGPQGTMALQILQNDLEKLDLPYLQTTSLDNDWMSSIYSTELPEEISNKPIRIQISVEQPKDIVQRIAIQRIAGCNSEGFEDIYVESPNTEITKMNFQAYDVTVKRIKTDSKEELECLNGGLFDSERNSCICPPGFMGKTCDIGCGPDRYDSKCSAHCSKTRQGCMGMQLCRPKLGCNCAPGMKGNVCDIRCHKDEYGAGCEQKCGKCTGETCDIYTGQCPSGCQEGFYPPLCQSRYKHLTASPEVVSVDYHTLQVAFNTAPEFLEGKGTPTFYQIQLRDTENDENAWTEREPILLPATEIVETNVTDLKPGTNYEVRVVLLDVDGNSYQGKNVPVANGFTNCTVPEVDYKLSVMSVGHDDFRVHWKYSQEQVLWCKVTHFEVDVKMEWKWELQYKGDEFGFTLLDLLPGEEYPVRVRGISVNGPLPYSPPRTVTTDDNVPEAVHSTTIVSRTHNQIEIEWKEPFTKGGKIDKYKVTYKCEKLLACKEYNCSDSAGEFEVRTTSVTLRGLRPLAQYRITIAAMAAFYGPEVQLLATTNMADKKLTAQYCNKI